MRSFRQHDIDQFTYIEVVSPTIRIADIKVDSHTQFESILIQKSHSPTYLSSKLFCIYIYFKMILLIAEKDKEKKLHLPCARHELAVVKEVTSVNNRTVENKASESL